MAIKNISPEGNDLAELRSRIRHSAAHVMAEAVLALFPDAQFAVGPSTSDGFYYDFAVERSFTPEDLQKIEDHMRDTIEKNLVFEYSEISRTEATERFSGQQFKLEIIDSIPDDEAISIYKHGDFVDLCRGPHINSSSDIVAVKLMSVAGAYWRGDEKNPMLQRIYGTAWESESKLEEHLQRLEEAAKRDHRRLGQDLKLFFFDSIAPASPFFLPNGSVLSNTLIEYVRDLYQRYGYKEVITPQVFDSELWKKSGHYENYKENMYFTYIEDREFGVKPMNCPAAALIYNAELHSYRDLPLRYADFGRLHRFERSGVTHGLTRVRTFSQDDAHIFCTPEQVESEISSFISMVEETFRVFQFDDVRVALSLRPDKRIGDDALWDKAEGALASALDRKNIEFEAIPNEGAFYGPKIDFFVADAIGREWQLSTVQLDYNLPERFNLEYVDPDDERQRPVVIHRAMLGSLERFLGVVIEHFGGAFPTWLAPIQVQIIPIADRHIPYADQLKSKLEGLNIRVDVDSRSERMNSKIRQAQLYKIPYMLIVGDKEQDQDGAAVRLRSGEDLGVLETSQICERIYGEVIARS
ncbi:MAG: threonine--tRNA ligase [Chloroflexi bacterium]|nr:threonine--tRNA ligase [Chloroflexota bacterium]|tara:strand:+ start:11288 stop:13036 length:1749 start_codon:yes stop_codon:yes gene_type:complete